MVVLTDKQLNFCIEYTQTRDLKQSCLKAGYSETFSKSKSYELLNDERIKEKIKELEENYFNEHFKKLSLVANKELLSILTTSKNDNIKLKAIELIYKLSGVLKDERLIQIEQPLVQTATLDDFYPKN